MTRILTHPCSSHAKQSTTSDLYNENTYRGSNTFAIVTLGILAGVIVLCGIIFFVDRETFWEITTGDEVPYYCKCSKHSIDDDDDISAPTPFERDNYHLTEETRDYLAEKREREVEKPRRRLNYMLSRLKSLFSCCFKPRKYDEEDKYHIPWTGDENDSKHANLFLAFWEEVRLRLCWKPTKVYNERDKYAVNLPDLSNGGGEEDDDEAIKYAASSYESAEKGAAPW